MKRNVIVKANLIENLVLAHCRRDENAFKKALDLLAMDEEKKGNVILSSKIRKAYEYRGETNNFPSVYSTIVPSFLPQSIVPRDKDSLLELYEIINSDIKLEDVVLQDNQRRIIKQILEEQQNVVKLSKYKMVPVNKVLFCGPPGCGKTMTAKAIARELDLPIAYVRLDGLVSSYLGQTSSNLRKVFDSVRNQRIVLFLDEFDAIAKKRDDENELGELKRVVTTLLQNFDNMPTNVFLIAATNHEHLLDPAIWRRFNITVTLDLPNKQQRLILLSKWFKEYKIGCLQNLDFLLLAQISEGLNCAQLKELVLASCKHYVINGDLKTEDVTKILILQLTKFSSEINETTKIIVQLNDRGVSTRQIGKAFGIPYTTLDYKIKKYRKNNQGDEL